MRKKKSWIKLLFKRKRYIVGGVKDRKTEYVEEDTQCDKCENLSKCIENGIIISTRTMMDTRDHYSVGIGAVCKKDPLSQLFVAIEAYQELRDWLKSEDAVGVEFFQLFHSMMDAFGAVEMFQTKWYSR